MVFSSRDPLPSFLRLVELGTLVHRPVAGHGFAVSSAEVLAVLVARRALLRAHAAVLGLRDAPDGSFVGVFDSPLQRAGSGLIPV